MLGEFYEGPPWCLFYPKLWLTLGDSATGNEVDDDGDGVMGDVMGSSAMGYGDDGNDDGNGQDNNNATMTMATAHQAGNYAHFILTWKNMWRRRNGRRQ